MSCFFFFLLSFSGHNLNGDSEKMLLLLIYCLSLLRTMPNSQETIEDTSEFISEEFTDVSDLDEFQKCIMEPYYLDSNYVNASCQNTSYAALQMLPPNTINLDFNGNNISVFKRSPFRKFTVLEYLNMANNRIETVKRSGLKKLRNLKTLKLDHNLIETLSTTVFHHCLMLEDVDLSYNNLVALYPVTTAMKPLTRLQRLSFYHNLQIRIINEDDFKSLSKSVTYLNLGHCGLKTIRPNAFSHLENLRHLVLSENPEVSESELDSALCNITRKIEILELSELGLGKIPTTALQHLSTAIIKYLNLHSNFFSVNYGYFPLMPSLLKLNLKNCHITKMEENMFANLTSLQELDISRNRFTSLTPAIYSTTTLMTLDLSQNTNYYQLVDDRFNLKQKLLVNMTSLRTLILDHLDIHELNRYALHGLQNLENLYIRNSLTTIEDFSFESLQNLKLLNLSTNNIKTLSRNLLTGATNLNTLILSRNRIALNDDCEDTCFGQQTPNLRKLDLSHNTITHIPVKHLSPLPHLEELLLSDNNLIPWTEPGAFSKQRELTIVDLKRNNFNTITLAMQGDFETISEVDVSENPFNCSSCEVHEFITWFNSTTNTRVKNIINMSCALPDKISGHLLINLPDVPWHCDNGTLAHGMTSYSYEIVISVVIIFVFLIIMVGLCYYFRWYLRYYWFISRSRIRRVKNSSVESNYKFDAFISYNINDRPWLVERLLPNLEETEPKLSLCLHERDFEIGREIWNNIVDSIDSSRKVVLLLSNNFLNSQWCTWEMNMAQFKLVDDAREALILILLEKLDKKNVTSSLRYLIRTRTYLEWSNNAQGQKIFWERLKHALQKPYTNTQQTLL